MSDLFAPPAPGASSFHHLPIPANQSFRDGLEAIPCQAQPEGTIPVGCPGRGSEEVKLLDVAKGTQIRREDLPSDDGRDTTDRDAEPTGAPTLRLQPEAPCDDVRLGRSGRLLLCRKEDIPRRKTFTAKALAWDSCPPQQLLKDFFRQPHQPFCFEVGNDQRED